MKIDKEVNDETSFCIIAMQISYLLSISRHIPNLFTLSNLSLGLLAIIFSFSGFLAIASYCILIATFLDFLDGLLARILNANSDLGKQLDSLADLVSFGVAPSIIVFHLLAMQLNLPINDFLKNWKSNDSIFIPFIALIIPLFSALRLARFNTIQNTSSYFAGLPTPANALFYISIPIAMKFQSDSIITEFFSQQSILIIAIILLSCLMVSKIKFLSLKMTSLEWSLNQTRYIFLSLSALLLLIFHFAAVPIIIILYFTISLFNTIKK